VAKGGKVVGRGDGEEGGKRGRERKGQERRGMGGVRGEIGKKEGSGGRTSRKEKKKAKLVIGRGFHKVAGVEIEGASGRHLGPGGGKVVHKRSEPSYQE